MIYEFEIKFMILDNAENLGAQIEPEKRKPKHCSPAEFYVKF